MIVALIIFFVLLALFCFIGMVGEQKDQTMRDKLLIGFFILVFCITFLALYPIYEVKFILTFFQVFLILDAVLTLLWFVISHKNRKQEKMYIQAIKDHDEKLAEANKIAHERNNILIEKNNKLVDALIKITEPQKEGE